MPIHLKVEAILLQTAGSTHATEVNLIDRGHIKYLKDIPEETQEKFINEFVQHWIPW